MNPLQGAVGVTVTALWLGHESIETTQIYLHAGMAKKEAARASGSGPYPTPAVPTR